jgi:membrane protein
MPLSLSRWPLWIAAASLGAIAVGGFLSRPASQTLGHDVASDNAGENAGGDRGRHARTPWQIERRGWKDIFLRIYDSLGKDRLVAVAAGIAFYSLLALFPAIAALVSLYGFFADPATIADHIGTIADFVPGGGVDVIQGQIDHVASQGRQALGLTFLFSFLVSLWSANKGTKAMFDALNVVYHEEEKRGFFKLNALSLLFTIGGVVFVLVALGVIIVLPLALDFIGLGQTADLIDILRWPVLFAAIAFALAVVYRYGPSRDKAQWRWVSWGSVLAAFLWIAASILFSWYAENFGSFNKTYGSLGAVIGFMTWIWLSALVVLLGAELDAEMEHQTMHDTTEGPSRPMGWRGARVADSIGPARD